MEPCGTVKPLQELDMAPVGMPPDEMLAWLNLLDKGVKEDPWYIL